MKLRIATMRIGKRIIHIVLGGLAVFGGLQCTENPVETAQGGGGSEAVALVGSFEYPDHRPAAGASVRLRPKLFLSETDAGTDAQGTVIDVETDAEGGFRIDSVKRGEYFIEIADTAGQGLLIPCTLTGDTDTVTLGKAELAPTGAVTGNIVAPEGFTGRTTVQVYGLDRQVKADSATGRFHMEGIPEGTYTLRAVYSAPAVDPREIDSVAASSDSINDIGAIRLASFENENYSAWPQSRRIYLNTTPAGAGVAGGVDDFPVLVRLTGDVFDFAKSTGRDIRFSDSKGKRLRYEVERWDSAAASADLWVRLDRVNGNSNAQFITMHWGLAGAEDVTDARQVFAADAGFAGVWHLGEDAPDTVASDLYKDAVGYDPAADRVASGDRSGVAGFGAGLADGDHIIVPVAHPLLQPTSKVSVSAWVRGVRMPSLGGTVLSMGDSYSLRVNADGTGRFAFFNGTTAAVETPRTVNLLDSAWHHLAATYDGAFMAIYVDGRLSARVAAKGSIDYRFWPAFVMGRHGNRKAGYEFTGNIDQIEVSGETARSADWIRLSYESQRTGSKLIEFRP